MNRIGLAVNATDRDDPGAGSAAFEYGRSTCKTAPCREPATVIVFSRETADSKSEKPVVALVGGSKVSSRIDLLDKLVRTVDCLVIGGGLANTFLAALGHRTGTSMLDRNAVPAVQDLLRKADATGCRILLPVDVTVARTCEDDAERRTVPVDRIPDDMMALDIGPMTRRQIIGVLMSARTLLWHGPLGASGTRPFDQATTKIAGVAAQLTRRGQLTTIAGGGIAAALRAAGMTGRLSDASTTGDAVLEWLAARHRPETAAPSSPKTRKEFA